MNLVQFARVRQGCSFAPFRFIYTEVALGKWSWISTSVPSNLREELNWSWPRAILSLQLATGCRGEVLQSISRARKWHCGKILGLDIFWQFRFDVSSVCLNLLLHKQETSTVLRTLVWLPNSERRASFVLFELLLQPEMSLEFNQFLFGQKVTVPGFVFFTLLKLILAFL